MHLEFRTLSAFADGEIGRSSLGAVQAHLRGCASCRDELRFIRVLGEALRSLPSPAPPCGLIDEIFPQESGPGNVIEYFDPQSRFSTSRSRRVALSLAASVAGLLATFLTLTIGADRAMAGSSTMTLRRAETGVLTVRYETATPLSVEPGLRARIRYWVPDSLRFTQTTPGFATIELGRREAGSFEGIANLPPDAVYAMAAVEDRRGDRIDTNRGRFWEYIEADEGGRPTLRGRLYQMLAMSDISVSRGIQVAEQAAAEFPERIEFWAHLLLFTTDAAPASSNDAALRAKVERLELFDAAARRRNAGPNEMYDLSRSARQLGRSDLETYWDSTLNARYPRHEYASQSRLWEIVLSPDSDRQKLSALDRNWRFSPMPAVAQLGLEYSYESADSVVTRTWLERYASEPALRSSGLDGTVAERLSETPAFSAIAERWISGLLGGNGGWLDAKRPLEQTRRSFELDTAERRARLNLLFGRLRLDSGDLAGGLTALERARQLTWSPGTLVELAELYLDAGSPNRASELLALVQSDPVVPIEPYVIPGDDRETVGPSEDQLQSASDAWREQVASSLLNEQIDLSARIRTPAGEETTLREVVRGSVTLVIQVNWSTPTPLPGLQLLHANAENLEASAAQTILIGAGAASPTQAESHPTPLARRPYYDERFEVWEALGAVREFRYSVLDVNGSLRHRGEVLATGIRAALLLGTAQAHAEAPETTKPKGREE